MALAGPALAQFTQYQAPGGSFEAPATVKDAMEKAMETCRVKVGPLRVGPWFAVRNLSYVKNPTDFAGYSAYSSSDLTASVGAGVQAFAPFRGARSILGFYLLPEYVWWARDSWRRTLGGRYGTALATELGRFDLSFGYGLNRQQNYASQDTFVQTVMDSTRGYGNLKFNVTSRWGVVANYSYGKFGYPQNCGPNESNCFRSLDNTTRSAGGGLSFSPTRSTSITVTGSKITSDAVYQGVDRSSRGTAWSVGMGWSRSRYGVSGSWGVTRLDPVAGSSFVPYSGSFGNLNLWLRPGGRLRLGIYGSRGLGYSLGFADSYLIGQTVGVTAGYPVWRGSVQAYVQKGYNDYPGSVRSASVREDYQNQGISGAWPLVKNLGVTIGVNRWKYESPLGGLGRNWTRTEVIWGINYNLGQYGQVGSAGSAW